MAAGANARAVQNLSISASFGQTLSYCCAVKRSRPALNLPEAACRNNRSRGDAMLGLMQDWPLLCHRIIDHAAVNHAERCVISRSIEGPIHSTTYTAIRGRALKVAKRLDKDGIRLGDRVAT